MLKKISYLFLFSVLLFVLYQYLKYEDTLKMIWTQTDINTVRHQAVMDES